MGNYRPKTLDELSNMYGKSIEADQEIKKGSSKLGTVKAPVSDAFADEMSAEPTKVTPEQIAADEIANEVKDFAKSFGSTGTGRAPANITAVQSRPRVPKRKPETAPSEETGKSKCVPVQKEQKNRLVRNERTNLFDSYKSVMNDEDDSDLDLEDNSKRERRKKKTEKKSKVFSAKPVKAEEITDEVSANADKAVAAVFGEDEKEVAVTEKADITVVTQQEAETPLEELDNENTSVESAPKGNPVRRAVFTAILLIVLMLSVSVGGIKAFMKLNTDSVAFGGYQLYSAEASYAGTSIGKGDLVFVENRQPSRGETIAYRDNSGEYGFVTFEAALNSESMTVSGSTDKIVVFINEYRGAVIRTMPSVGGILAVVTEYFHLIMAVLFLLIGLLILLIIFSSKAKAETSSDKADEDGEAESEEDEAEDGDADPFEAFVAGDSFGEYEESDGYEAVEQFAEDDMAAVEDNAQDEGSVSGSMYDLLDDDE